MSSVPNGKISESGSQESWEEWVSRLQAYVTWLNTQLKKHPKYRTVSDLRSDLQDGVVIAQLIEVLGGECIENIDLIPSTPKTRKENVEKVFKYLISKKVPIFDAAIKDVLDGDLKRIMRLIHAVASHYRPDSVLNPPSHKCVSSARSEPNKKNMTSTGKPPPSSLARQKQITPTSSFNRKVTAGSSLPVRRQPLSTRDCHRMRTTISSLSLDRDKSNLRKSFNTLNADCPSKGICDVANMCHSSSSRLSTPRVACKVAPLQHSIPQTHNSKLIKKKLVSKSEPCSLDSVDLKENELEKTDEQKTISCSCSKLNNDIIDQLLKDIKEAKQLILLLQELLLHGNAGKLIKNSERSVPYGSTNELDIASPRTLTHESASPETSVIHRPKPSESLSMICGERKNTQYEESTKLKQSGCDPPLAGKKSLREENEILRQAVTEKEQEIKRLKVALSSQAMSYDKKISKFPYSITARTQREELQVVHEALTSLRKCFPANDPYQHTLDTIEQSLSALLERVNSLEMATVSPLATSSTRDVDSFPSVVRRLSFESATDNRHHSIPKISSFNIQRLEDTSTLSENFTKVVYYMDKSVTPFRCILHKRIGEATLKDFKLLFDRPGQYRYHFKTLDPEFGMVKEEVLHDDDILPGWDGKIIVWIEEDCS